MKKFYCISRIYMHTETHEIFGVRDYYSGGKFYYSKVAYRLNRKWNQDHLVSIPKGVPFNELLSTNDKIICVGEL